MRVMGRMILERDDEVAVLGTAVRNAGDGAGSVVLLRGEAGIGKSSLVESIRGLLPADGRFLIGYCDDLATPRVLGPLRDMIGSLGPEVVRALERGDRGAVMTALRDEVNHAGQPTVIVVEDVHWADEATLDVLCYLIRRAAHLPLLLALTYRDEEVDSGHPLRQVLGVAARVDGVHRLRPARLSLSAVRWLTSAAEVASGVDPAEVFALTSGNPYLVTETLA